MTDYTRRAGKARQHRKPAPESPRPPAWTEEEKLILAAADGLAHAYFALGREFSDVRETLLSALVRAIVALTRLAQLSVTEPGSAQELPEFIARDYLGQPDMYDFSDKPATIISDVLTSLIASGEVAMP